MWFTVSKKDNENDCKMKQCHYPTTDPETQISEEQGEKWTTMK
jgi:hypothetical protein